MPVRNIIKSTIPFIMLLLSMKVLAQNALLEKVQSAHNSGIQFEKVDLFITTTGDTHETVVKNASLLKTDAGAVANLYARKPQAVSLTFTTATGKEYTVELLQSHPLADVPEIGYIDASGRHTCSYEEGLHYQGIVLGSRRSVAAMSVFANGEVMILFANEDGNFNIGKLEDGNGNYIFYNDKQLLYKNHGTCYTVDKDVAKMKNINATERTTSTKVCKKVRIYWECSYYIDTSKGGFASAQIYMLGFFNQMQAIYANETIAVELSSLYIWTIPDTYKQSITLDNLMLFARYWNLRGNSFNGDIAMVIMHDNTGAGVAYLDAFADRNYAYAWTGLKGIYSSLPVFSLDLDVIAHETGHQLGSNHTHNCGWNTGPGGSCGAIDNCYTVEPAGSCSTCPCTDSTSKTGWSGTIMSYCDFISSIGINFANGFGPLPGNFIRNNINSASTLQSIIGVKLTPTAICSSDGAITLSFNSDNFGTAPYTYYWSGGKTTQNISGLSLPGNYSVIITDSNNCSTTVITTVAKQASPGNGQGPNFQPICCKDTSFTYTITASAPANLMPCHTVAWLRTSAAISSFSAAQTAFNSASASDIVYSTNSNSVSSTTAATLNVPSPTPCSAQSYYYTPFITKKARTAVVLADSNTTVGAITSISQIGNYTTLADQNSLITICDTKDTATINSLVVTVTGYTGRPNYMTLSVQNSSGNELYYMNSLAGNGTYIIPVKASDNLLQYLKVSAYDFNYKKVDTVIASSLSIKATRNITYPAISQISFENVCNVGASAHLSFAPNACVKLDAANVGNAQDNITVYPNPGSDIVTLEFNAHGNGTGIIRLTDVMGRTIETIPVVYSPGNNKVLLDIHNYTNGIYFLVFSTEEGSNSKIKLVVAK